MSYIALKNWEEYQHYKDRNPPWVKLHQNMMTSDCWVMSGEHEKALMIGLMLLAARFDNNICADPYYLKKVLHLDKEPNLDFLAKHNFITYSDEEIKLESPWPSRHVTKEVRQEVLDRDNSKCVQCGSVENIEIDHIIPVSKGGESVIENLQALCRPCNRRKRNTVADATQRTALRTQRREEKRRDREEGEADSASEDESVREGESEAAGLASDFHFRIPGMTKPLLPDLLAHFDAKLTWLRAMGRNETEFIRACIQSPKRDKSEASSLGKMFLFWKFCEEESNGREFSGTGKRQRNETVATSADARKRSGMSAGGGQYEGIKPRIVTDD